MCMLRCERHSGKNRSKIYRPLSFFNAGAHRDCKIKTLIGLGGMRPYQIFPKRRMIPHPCCDVCDADMWLICIEPEKLGHDRRTFECPRCQHVKVEIVNYGEQNE